MRTMYRAARNIATIAVLLSITASFVVNRQTLPTVFAASRDPVRARHGVVASTNEVASQVGVDIMKRGGNAVDAAIAVAFALAVTHPAAGNLGGGGFMMARVGNANAAIDYRETAPGAATATMYLGPDGQLTRDRLVGP